MLRRFIVVFIFFALFGISFAQDNAQAILNQIERAYQTQATSLDLSGLGLTEIPSEIGKLTYLEEMDVSFNNIQELPDEIRNLNRLHTLNLSLNNLSEIPDEIFGLKALETLSLDNNPITEISPKLELLTNLKSLTLGSNSLTEFPIAITKLPNLEMLKIWNAPFKTLPSEIGNLTTLNELWLGRLELHTIPPEIGNLTHLEILSISYNDLSDLPSELSQLQNLKILILNTNNFTHIPDVVTHLQNLNKLDMSVNHLQDLPTDFGKLSNLQILQIAHNDLGTTPISLYELSNLKSLDLSANELITIPADIQKLQSLNELNLGLNTLIYLPSEIGNLDNLYSLNISSNQFITLPKAIYGIRNLDHLDASSNQITSIPEGFGGLTQLMVLDLSRNQLNNLPSDMSNLAKLETLYLMRNQFTDFPDVLYQIPNLQSLYLGSNQLTALPSDISNLKTLRNLRLSDNKLRTLPSEIENLTNLCYLDVSHNQLTGLPSTLSNLHHLADDICISVFEGLNISGNQPLPIPYEALYGEDEMLLEYLQNPISWYLARVIQWIIVFTAIFVVIHLIGRFIDRKLLQPAYADEAKVFLKRAVPNRRISFMFVLPLFLVAMSPFVNTVYQQDKFQILSVSVISIAMFWLITLGTIRATIRVYHHISTLDTLYTEHPRHQFLVSLWLVIKHRWVWHLLCVFMFLSLGLAIYGYLHYGYENKSIYLPQLFYNNYGGIEGHPIDPSTTLPIIPHIIPVIMGFLVLVIDHIAIIMLLSASAIKWGFKQTIFIIISVIIVGWLGVFTLEYFKTSTPYSPLFNISNRTFLRVYESTQTILMNPITLGAPSLATFLNGHVSDYNLFPVRHLLILLATVLGQLAIAWMLLRNLSFNRKRKRQD